MDSQGEKKRIGRPESSQNKKSVPSNAEFMLKLYFSQTFFSFATVSCLFSFFKLSQFRK